MRNMGDVALQARIQELSPFDVHAAAYDSFKCWLPHHSAKVIEKPYALTTAETAALLFCVNIAGHIAMVGLGQLLLKFFQVRSWSMHVRLGNTYSMR